jgi:hypothetical protein
MVGLALMARIRTIKPEFWGDPKTARVSRDARLLFIGLLNESDDEGRQLGSPRKIAGEVFPNDEDVTLKLIGRWLDELEKVGFVRRYVVDEIPYLQIVGFTAHQKVSHPSPSRLPPEPLANESDDARDALGPDLVPRNIGIDLGADPDAPPWRGTGIKPVDFALKTVKEA